MQEMRSKKQTYLHDDIAGTSDDRDLVGKNECNAHCRIDMPSCNIRIISAACLWSGCTNVRQLHIRLHEPSADTGLAV